MATDRALRPALGLEQIVEDSRIPRTASTIVGLQKDEVCSGRLAMTMLEMICQIVDH